MDEPVYPFRTLSSSTAVMATDYSLRLQCRVQDRFPVRKILGPKRSNKKVRTSAFPSTYPTSDTVSTYGPVRLRKRFTRPKPLKSNLTRPLEQMLPEDKGETANGVETPIVEPVLGFRDASSSDLNISVLECTASEMKQPPLNTEEMLSKELFVDIGSDLSREIDLAKRGILLKIQAHLRKQKDDQVADFDPAPGGVLKPFAIHRPNGFISMKNYMKRIEELADEISPTMFIAAVVYMDRCHQKNPESVRINRFTIHKLFFTSLLIACQYWEDNNYQLSFMAKVGGMSLREMKFLQGKFLELVQFDLEISAGVWIEYVQQAIAVYRQEQEKQKTALLVNALVVI